MSAVWRLVVHDAVDGALNMAIDRAIQVCRERDGVPPTLRLYRWARPTVTLGRFQHGDAIEREWCDAHGIDVVRRFTGGRGVLHDDELTYSVVAHVDDGVPRGVAASYRHLCSALVETYRRLGVEADLTTRDRGEPAAGACYLQTTRADLAAADRKLSGSAQVWLGSTVLQHGSLVVGRDVAREAEVFGLTEEQTSRLLGETVTMEDLRGERPTLEALVQAAVGGFERALDIELRESTLTALEAEIAADLLGDTCPDRVPGRAVRV